MESSSALFPDTFEKLNTVFTRLAAYGLELVGPFAEQSLTGCHCGRGTECRHVRTFAFQRNPENRPNQLDFVFATPAVQPGSCRALDDEAAWRYSDHLPVISTFAVAGQGIRPGLGDGRARTAVQP